MRTVSWDDDDLLEIKDSDGGIGIVNLVNIIDLISPHVILKPQRGGEYSGLCPFHSEKNPSFSVNEDKGVYLCRACGEKGNALTWLMRHDGMTKREAFSTIRKMAGLDDLSGNDMLERDSFIVFDKLIKETHQNDSLITKDYMFWEISDTCGDKMKSAVDDDSVFDRVERILMSFDRLYLSDDEKEMREFYGRYPKLLYDIKPNVDGQCDSCKEG